MGIQDEQLRKLIDHIFDSHQDDVLDCDSCGCQLECLAEKVAGGASLREMWPEVEAHLMCCRDCREEWQALLCILRAESNGQLSTPEK
ncbi:MAG: hypothetical protein J0L63_13980 [Anaerolineae bacterium]|nr:hypothetical protein [Anaerolineae bacterium]MBN8620013.1 hypothetical protein [Anaerolineae bacterium]